MSFIPKLLYNTPSKWLTRSSTQRHLEEQPDDEIFLSQSGEDTPQTNNIESNDRLKYLLSQKVMNLGLLEIEKKNIYYSWRYFINHQKINIQIAGSILGTATGCLGILWNQDSYLIAQAGVGILSASISILVPEIISDKVHDELKRIEKAITLFTKESKEIQWLIQLDQSVKKFQASWDAFINDPTESKIKCLFVLHESIKASLDYCNEEFTCHLSTDFTSFASAIENPLFLMESVCNKIQNGPIVDTWKKLKQSSSENLLWANQEAEPWNSLGIENPPPKAYIEFFRCLQNQNEQQQIQIADKTSKLFQKSLNNFLSAFDTDDFLIEMDSSS